MNKDVVSEEQLCAYADGRLAGAEAERLAARLAEEPALAARLADWRRQKEGLRALFDPVLDEAVPQRLLDAASGKVRPVRRRAPPLRWAAAVAWLALGGLLGYGLRDYQQDADVKATGILAALPRQAAIAHAVYVPEVRHPVEVDAAQQAHLVGWLSKRLGMRVEAPQLEAAGYKLMGGRLLPSDAGPGAQFMYQDGDGRRLTLYLNHSSDRKQDTAFRFADEGGIGVFYWVDGGTGYALSAELPRQRLLQIANVVYKQLNP